MQIKDTALTLSRHKFVRYVCVGGSTFLLQMIILWFVHGQRHTNITVAASIAYWVSVVYNFTLNRWWSFSSRDLKNLHKHLITYGILLAFNYFTSVALITVLSKHINYGIANVMIVGVQMIWNYYIYKNYIFKQAQD